MTITPEEMRTLAQSLEINPRGATHNERSALQLAIRGNQDAAAMLRSIAAEREAEVKRLCGIDDVLNPKGAE